MSNPKAVICPYCGQSQTPADRCRACLGLFEPLSRQATHNAMGPWFVRDPARPFHPGCSYETLVKMIERGLVTKLSILRGPTTRQFWTVAKRTPGISHLLGYCHACDANVSPSDHGCGRCGVPFGAYLDRDYLGLPEIKPLPWEADVERALSQGLPRVTSPPASISETSLTAGAAASGANGGLSRFASNEELLGRAAAPWTEREGPTTAALSPQAGVRPSDVGVSSYDIPAMAASGAATSSLLTPVEFAASPLARSMQRRMEAQRRLIVMLIIGLGVLAVLVLFAMLPRLTSPAVTVPEQPSATQSSASQPQSPPIQDATPVPASVPVPEATQPASSGAPVAPASPTADQPEEPAGPYVSEFDRADLLLRQAEDIDRPLADRIKDAEEAILILENIEVNAPADQRPEGLGRTLADARTLLERLKLRTIMP